MFDCYKTGMHSSEHILDVVLNLENNFVEPNLEWCELLNRYILIELYLWERFVILGDNRLNAVLVVQVDVMIESLFQDGWEFMKAHHFVFEMLLINTLQTAKSFLFAFEANHFQFIIEMIIEFTACMPWTFSFGKTEILHNNWIFMT